MYRFGFLIEQALGHITHSKNLQLDIPNDPNVEPEWGLIPWEVDGWARHLPIYKSNWTVRAGLRARGMLAEMERRGPLDAIMFHTQVSAMLAQDWLERIPSVLSLDATPAQYDRLGEFYGHKTGPGFLEDWKRRLAKRAFHKARHLVTWSEWAKQSLIDEYGVAPGKITVIPPGVNTKLWRRTEPYCNTCEPIRILFVGGNLERKGGLLLLEAFRRLRAEGLALELHLVTRDSLEGEAGVFVYHDVAPNSKPLIDLYHQSDIFCLPTFGDCLAIVLCEAAAAGVPLISTHVAAIPEIVREGETGLLITPGNIEELVVELRRLATEPELRRKMGIAAENLALQKLDAEQNAVYLLDIMKHIADEERAYRYGKGRAPSAQQEKALTAPINEPPKETIR